MINQKEQNIFNDAIEKNKIDIVKSYINNDKINPHYEDIYALLRASELGYHEIVKLLLNDTRVNPTYKNSYAIYIASVYNHYEVVKILLEDGRVDPVNDNNIAIAEAYIKNYHKVVETLFNEHTVRDNLRKNHPELFNILLKKYTFQKIKSF